LVDATSYLQTAAAGPKKSAPYLVASNGFLAGV
jgi:hypothetical protein